MDIDWVSFLTDPVTLASALACVATFATVMTLAARPVMAMRAAIALPSSWAMTVRRSCAGAGSSAPSACARTCGRLKRGSDLPCSPASRS